MARLPIARTAHATTAALGEASRVRRVWLTMVAIASLLAAPLALAQAPAAPNAVNPAAIDPAANDPAANTRSATSATAAPKATRATPVADAPRDVPAATPDAGAPRPTPKTQPATPTDATDSADALRAATAPSVTASTKPAVPAKPTATPKKRSTKAPKRHGKKPTPAPHAAPAPDAGPAPDAPDAAAKTAPVLEAREVKYHDEPAFQLAVRPGVHGDEARFADAEKALAAAIDGDPLSEEAPVAAVQITDDMARVAVRGHAVTMLTLEDARAARFSNLQDYGDHVQTVLTEFVPAQISRGRLQKGVLHLFWAVFIAVIAFVSMGQIGAAFDRADRLLDERRGQLKPVRVLRIPVLSGDAFGGLIAFGLAVGRVVSYVAAVAATIAAILGTFDATRPYVRLVLSFFTDPVLSGFQALGSSLPGILFAIVLVVVLRAALRVLNLLLDGVSSKRIEWSKLPPERVPLFRLGATVLAIVIVAPYAIGAAFGSYDTPAGHLALGVGVVLLIAAVPIVASALMGMTVIWRDNVRAGDWVSVGNVSGEVTQLSVHELSLVPESGGTISVPMLYLLWNPLRRLRRDPEIAVDITVARDRPASALIDAMRTAVTAVDEDAQVECVDICHAWLKLRVSAPSVRTGIRQALLVAISDAVDAHAFELPVLHGPERGAL